MEVRRCGDNKEVDIINQNFGLFYVIIEMSDDKEKIEKIL